MSDNPHSDLTDAKVMALELYESILAKLKGGYIYGELINLDDPVSVAVGAYLLGAQEEQYKSMKEKTAIFDLFERA